MNRVPVLSSQAVENLWPQWSRGLWLGDPFCRTRFKILPMVHCVTPLIQAISTCRRHSREPSNMPPEIWLGITWTLQNPDRPEGLFNGWESGESNPIHPFSWPSILTSNESVHSKPHVLARQFLTEIHWNHFQKLGPYVSKLITANKIHFAVS